MRNALAWLMVVALGPLTLGAQSPSQEPSSAQAGSTAGTTTVIGCLARGDAPDTFVLKNVSPPPAAAGAAQPSSHSHHQDPTAAPSAPPTPGETLRLTGAAAVLKLDAHVGHTIRATGTIPRADHVVSPGVVLPEPQGDTTSRTRETEARAAPATRAFVLRSMEHVAGECK